MRRPFYGRLVRLFWVLGLTPPALISAQMPVGPLSTSEQNPLYRLLHVPDWESADLVEEDAVRIEFSTAYSNIFEASERERHTHLFDLEQMTNSLTLRFGMSASLELGARVGLYTGWEGFLDPAISRFHSLFGLPDGGRETQPEGQYRLDLEHDDLVSGAADLGAVPRTLALEDVRIHAKWRFHGGPGRPTAASLRGALRVAGGPLSGGRLDGAVTAHGRWSTGRLHIHASTGLTVANPPSKLAPITSRHAVLFMAATEYSGWRRLSVLAQLSGSTSYFKGFDGGELGQIPLTLTVGAGGQTDGGWGWQFSFAEDLLPTGASVDFTLDLELSRTLASPATNARDGRVARQGEP